jgi:hypothetical protein
LAEVKLQKLANWEVWRITKFKDGRMTEAGRCRKWKGWRFSQKWKIAEDRNGVAKMEDERIGKGDTWGRRPHILENMGEM